MREEASRLRGIPPSFLDISFDSTNFPESSGKESQRIRAKERERVEGKQKEGKAASIAISLDNLITQDEKLTFQLSVHFFLQV